MSTRPAFVPVCTRLSCKSVRLVTMTNLQANADWPVNKEIHNILCKYFQTSIRCETSGRRRKVFQYVTETTDLHRYALDVLQYYYY